MTESCYKYFVSALDSNPNRRATASLKTMEFTCFSVSAVSIYAFLIFLLFSNLVKFENLFLIHRCASQPIKKKKCTTRRGAIEVFILSPQVNFLIAKDK